MVVCSGDGCLFRVILPLCCIFVTDTIIINTLITTAIENTKDRGKVEKDQTKVITQKNNRILIFWIVQKVTRQIWADLGN